MPEDPNKPTPSGFVERKPGPTPGFIERPPTALSALTQPGLPQGEETVEDKISLLTKASRLLGSMGAQGIGAWMGGVLGTPLGPGGIAAGAMLGGAAGEATHQIGQQIFDPEGAPQTSAEAAQRISTAGVFGPAQEVGAIRGATGLGKAAQITRGLKPAEEVAQTAAEHGIPLTAGQRFQGWLSTTIEPLAKRFLGTGSIFRKLEESQNEALKKGAQTIAERILPKGTPKGELGVIVKEAIAVADANAGVLYRGALEDISAAGAQKLPLNMTGNLQQAAETLMQGVKLNSFFGKALGNIQARRRAVMFLKSFAQPSTTTTETLSILGSRGEPLTQTVTKTEELLWEEALKIRSGLARAVRKGELEVGEGALAQFNKALDAEMKTTLNNAGRKDLVKLFDTVNTKYKAVNDLMREQLIKRLINVGAHEKVGEILLSSARASDVVKLRKLIGVQEMTRVQQGLWKEFFTGGTERGIVVGKNLLKRFDDLGPDMQRALWPNPTRLNEIRRFINTANTTQLTAQVADPLSAQKQTLLGFGQVAAGRGMVLTMFRYALGDQQDAQDFALNVGGGALTMIAPIIVARWITRPGSVNMLTKALTTPAKSREGVGLGYKLMTLMVAEQLKESHEERKPYKPGR